MAGVPLLSVANTDVSAGGRTLLHGVRFDVQPAAVFGVTGPSGCGKSMLLRVVAGLADARSGAILLNGRDATEIGWPEYRRRVVLVSQQPVLLDASVRDNLERPFAYRAVSETFAADRAAALLDGLGVGADRIEQPARSLSVGEQQRVCFVRALLLNPDVLLLDEPTSALDDDAAALVEAVLRESVGEGECGAVLLVTHDRKQIQRLCEARVDLSEFGARAHAEALA